MTNYKVLSEDLRIKVDSKELGLNGKTTEILPILKGIKQVVGNEEAIEIIVRGLQDTSPNSHVILTGDPGVGKTMTCDLLLEEYCKKQLNNHLTDKVIVYNFDKREEPVIIELEKGTGKKFTTTIDDTILAIGNLVSDVGYDYQQKQSNLKLRYNIMAKAQKKATESKYKITKIPMTDPSTGQPLKTSSGKIKEVYEPQNQKEAEDYEVLQQDCNKIEANLMILHDKEVKLLQEQKDKDVEVQVRKAFVDVEKTYGKNILIKTYINGFVKEAVADIDSFLDKHIDNAKEQAIKQNPGLNSVLDLVRQGSNNKCEQVLDKYKVNLVVDNSKTVGIPFAKIEEPDMRSLIGEIESNSYNAVESKQPHFRVTLGKLIECDGGIVLLDNKFLGMFRHGMGLEQRLLITLEQQKAKICGNQNPFMPTARVETNEASARTKVVIVMNMPEYFTGMQYVPELLERFSYKAHFQETMKNDTNHKKGIASFVSKEVKLYNNNPQNKNVQVPHFSEEGIVALLTDMSRPYDQTRITTNLRRVKQVVLAAADLARRDNKKEVSKKHVIGAREQLNKSSIAYAYQQRLIEGFTLPDRKLLLSEGGKVGQINGLAYLGIEDCVEMMGRSDFKMDSVIKVLEYAFGTSDYYNFVINPGDPGKGLNFKDIEKVSGLVGKTHIKGVELLQAFYKNLTTELHDKKLLRGLPPGIVVDMSVPESWGGRDGPSATAAQTYALLSAISNIPIQQNIAVTGAMNTDGKVTVVGGLNEKTEGWYDILSRRGHLKNGAGVMLPKGNIADCNLRDDVINSIGKGNFSVYYHQDVRNGVEVVMGKSWDDVLLKIAGTFESWEKQHEEEMEKNIRRKMMLEEKIKKELNLP